MLAAAPFTALPRWPTRSARTRLIADAANCHHDFRPLGILLDLRPQPLNVHVHQPSVGSVPVAPHLLEQYLPGEHLAGLSGPGNEQVELETGEVERLASALPRVPGDVDPACARG